jgi:hypothetical protein
MTLSYTDPDGPGPYTVTIVTSPSNGSLTGSTNDRTYTPNAGFTGTDSFTWRVNDGLANSNTATVTITVSGSGIVSNTTPTAYVWDVLDAGKVQYVDRTYTFSAVPAAYVGLPYLKTRNDDKSSTGTSFVSFDLSQGATVYVAHDDRISPKPSWMSGFVDTGADLVSGGGTFSLFAKDFPAGRVTLGGNIPSGTTGNSMYTVVVRPLSGGGGFSVTIDFVSTGRPYSTATAKVGALPYIDRSYTIGSLSPTLANGVLLRTANDDKAVTAATHLKFTVSAPANVFVAYDKRATSSPTWLQSGWTLTSDALSTSDAGASPLRIYKKSVTSGQHTLGGNHHGGNTGAGSNYFVIVRPSSSTEASFGPAIPAGPLPEDVWEHPGDADGDGLYDAFEAAHFTDPALPDTDGDGDPDENELDGLGRTLWDAQAAGATAPAGDGDGSGGGCGATGGEAALLVLLRLRRRRPRRRAGGISV